MSIFYIIIYIELHFFPGGNLDREVFKNNICHLSINYFLLIALAWQCFY